jgi:cellobiose phosphorylase
MSFKDEIKVIYETPIGIPYHNTIETAIAHAKMCRAHNVFFSHLFVMIPVSHRDSLESVIYNHKSAISC